MLNLMLLSCTMKNTTGALIKNFLATSGLSKIELAKKIGVAPSTITYWISGERNPKRVNATKLEIVSNGLLKRSELMFPELHESETN